MVVSRIAALISGAPGRERRNTRVCVRSVYGSQANPMHGPVRRAYHPGRSRTPLSPFRSGRAPGASLRFAQGTPQEYFAASGTSAWHGLRPLRVASLRRCRPRSVDHRAYHPGRRRTPHSPFRSGRTPGVLLRGMASRLWLEATIRGEAERPTHRSAQGAGRGGRSRFPESSDRGR